MFDFSQVERFASKLAGSSNTTVLEATWKRSTAQNIAEEIRPPVNTGALAASVRPVDDGVVMLDYWRHLEYGTVHMAPRPFVRPAITQETPEALKTLSELLMVELA